MMQTIRLPTTHPRFVLLGSQDRSTPSGRYSFPVVILPGVIIVRRVALVEHAAIPSERRRPGQFHAVRACNWA